MRSKAQDSDLHVEISNSVFLNSTRTSVGNSSKILRTLDPDIEIIRQGWRVHEIVYLLKGFVKLQQTSVGGANIITEIIAPGNFIGIEPALLETDSCFSAICMTTCAVQCYSWKMFRTTLDSVNNTLSYRLHRQHALRFEHYWSRHLAMSSSGFSKQLIAHLAPLLSDEQIRMGTSPVPLHQDEIASMFCVTPEHLNRLLRVQEKRGLIRRYKRRLYFGQMLSEIDWNPGHCAVPKKLIDHVFSRLS
jgi:CRP-like cAMP-binding protein